MTSTTLIYHRLRRSATSSSLTTVSRHHLLHEAPRVQSRRKLLHNRKIRTFSSTRIQNNNEDNGHIHDVLIIGGGPSGLFLSTLLSSYGIHSHLLFDKRPEDELLKHPQAHFINIRSMEILKAEMPSVYNRINQEKPDVSEWERFHFGGTVMSSGGKRLGRVVHPVGESLRAGQSGNALLLPQEDSDDGLYSSTTTDNESREDCNYVSACRPAHLAQNKFVSLLLNEAKQRQRGLNKEINLRYGEEVTAINEIDSKSHSQPIISIQTSHAKTYRTRYLVAADGVHSFARQSFGIPMMGNSSMQNLINVHFQTNTHLSNMLMNKSDQAMLHFVYNSQLVGCFVCHNGRKGDWVLQIPFFPPYQTMDDFSIDIVREMIWAGLGMDKNEKKECEFDVLSIRPWTMSSLVAQSYVNKSNNLVLVGDAAHAFPPAGGFGMNTGLQDAHNLAWRLAVLLKNTNSNMASSILAKYESDRKPIATQNAALSVRNYNRTLRIAKASYLDAQHPALLTTVLGSPPMSLLPLETRQEMFRRLVRVAMMPLASLTSLKSSIHANHVERNVQTILKKGGSLPLVFPKYEIGFSYDHDSQLEKQDPSNDTKGYHHTMRVGYRLPHVSLEVWKLSSSNVNDGWSVLETASQQGGSSQDSCSITLTDISSQLRNVLSFNTPLVTLLVLEPISTLLSASINEIVDETSQKLNIPFVLVNILRDSPIDGRDGCKIITLIDPKQIIWKLTSVEAPTRADNHCNNAIVVIRPDGHIGSVDFVDDKNVSTSARTIVENGIKSAIGDFV